MADAPPAPTVADEPYQSLYRRYRPQRFADVKGQEHVTRALRNAVRDGRVAHAYLFSGPRGTGKTSTARILAMALNCAEPVDGEPDGTCASCMEIRRGSSLDVHELDAASNRKIDEMRDLLSRVALGISGRWKVYIVDEVHQLTPDAASMLLKTLEEPPGHVIFVLATTDPQKVLPTIRSRTQHFEFRLLGSEVLGELLRDVNERAGLGIATEAIDLVVRRGHGSARDALSVLDQVAAAGEVDDESTIVRDLVDAVADRDVGRVLITVAEAMSAGRDPRRVATDLIEHLRNGFLATQARGLVHLSDDGVAEVEGQARRLGLAGVVRAPEVVGLAAAEMRDSVDTRVTLEVALVRLTAPRADERAGALLERLERLEAEVSALGSGASSVVPVPSDVSGPQSRTSGALPAGEAGIAPSDPSSVRPEASFAPSPSPPEGRTGTAASAPAKATGPVSVRPRVGAPPPQPGRPRPSPRAGDGGPAAAHSAEVPRPVAGAGVRAAASGEVPRRAADDGRGSRPAQGDVARPPSRDELTKAWGDEVLPALRPGVKAYVSSGRFVEAGGPAAVYALPDAGLLARARTMQGEMEAALAARFGRPVPLRLVLDGDAGPVDVTRAGAGAAEEDPSAYDLDDLEDAGPAVVSPEQRLLEAFPGAEEVTP